MNANCSACERNQIITPRRAHEQSSWNNFFALEAPNWSSEVVGVSSRCLSSSKVPTHTIYTKQILLLKTETHKKILKLFLLRCQLEELKRRALNRREGNSDDLENPSDSNRAPASGEGDHLIAPEHVTELGDWNYLFRMLRYLEQMILTCPSRCMMCDKELSFSGYKPAICDAKLWYAL